MSYEDEELKKALAEKQAEGDKLAAAAAMQDALERRAEREERPEMKIPGMARTSPATAPLPPPRDINSILVHMAQLDQELLRSIQAEVMKARRRAIKDVTEHHVGFSEGLEKKMLGGK